MKIKKGDTVMVIAGADKGTVAEVIKAIPSEDKVVVEGVNMRTKHNKPTQANPDGGIEQFEAPIHVSNVMAYDAKAKKASRVAYKVENGKKVRVYAKTGAAIK